MSFGSNPDKSDLILEDSTKIPSTEEYVVLGVTIDNRLTFYNHLKKGSIIAELQNRVTKHRLQTELRIMTSQTKLLTLKHFLKIFGVSNLM